MSYLTRAFEDAGAVELRHLGGRHPQAGLFDDYDSLVESVYRLMEAQGDLYITLNKTNLTPTNAMGHTGVRNKDITRILRIPFDFDPVRQSGTASTDEQLLLAEQSMLVLKEQLKAHGWPEPLIGMSGNGYHLQYRTDFAVTEESISMMKRLYDGLKGAFSTERVVFDSTVKSAGQVFRLYGTVNRKGDNKSLWRKTHCTIPEPWEKVTLNQIFEISEVFKPVVIPFTRPGSISGSGCGDYNKLDIVSWFQAHGAYRHFISDNKHSVLCPFNPEHGHRDETIIFEPDGGWAGFHCPHDGCQSNGFLDLVKLWGDVDAYCHRANRPTTQGRKPMKNPKYKR